MNIWLCPVKPRNWGIIKSKKLFGVPKQGLKTFEHVRPGHLLVFHVLKPINGIVAICKVASDVFEDHLDIWGKNRYPFRVRIEILPRFTGNENQPIPLSSLYGTINSEEDITIEPYLKNVWITRISDKQYKRLKNLFNERYKSIQTS